MNNKTHDTNARTATSTDADVVQKYPGLAQRSEDDSLSASKPLPEHLRDTEQTEESESTTPSRSFSAERDPTQQKLTPTAKPAGGPVAQRDEQRDKPAKKPRLRFSRPTKDKTEKTDRTLADQTVVELPPTATQLTKKRLKLMGISLAGVLVLALVAIAVLFYSPILAIKNIEISGTSILSEQRATELLGPLKERPLPQVGDDEVMELLSFSPAVASVSTRAEPPDTLFVEVHEFTPVAMAPKGDGYAVFNDAAEEIATITAAQAQDQTLPVVSSAEDVEDPVLFNTITEVLGSLPDDLRQEVTQASGESIDSIELTLANDKTVVWGNAQDAEKKGRVVQALLALPDEESAQISEYDVSAPDHPVTR
ncbi:cell division protein FtsQ/DivIB [Auritidibacter ignavus]|uniref:Cell division protein FtsQ/DivIB n=1 Tax=Auritidibacter ignavus TaxID=678932 RepID=A0AAJ6DDL4_9MICC|nr:MULTISPECIES: FtsQ-type POTRA domain-containing protein [Auritidibacter]PXA76392.1 hypothetical protein DCC24_07645 [Auritidibacter sp. NML100628]WGH93972.1 cell division protein FtsQ/DivIB [Auritidibacter ignavus]